MRPVIIFAALSVVAVTVFDGADGHGKMLDPPGRNTVLNTQRLNENGFVKECPKGAGHQINYSDKSNFCGGRGAQNTNDGKCSACGDNWKSGYPRPHDYLGKYAKDITPVRVYLQGQMITVKVLISAQHLGNFEFRFCNLNEAEERKKGHPDALTECFEDKAQYTVLKTEDDMTKYTGPLGAIKQSKDYYINLKLPADETCTEGCSIQWRYEAGNNNDKLKYQEHFVNCADIIITSCEDFKAKRIANYCGLGPTEELKQCDGETGNDPGTSSGGSQSPATSGDSQQPGGYGQNQGTADIGNSYGNGWGENSGTWDDSSTGNTGTNDNDWGSPDGTGSEAAAPCNQDTANNPSTGTANEPSEGIANKPSTGTDNTQSTGTANTQSTGTANEPSAGTANTQSTGTANTQSTGTANTQSTGTANEPSAGTANEPFGNSPDESSVDSTYESSDASPTCSQCPGPNCDKNYCELRVEAVSPNLDGWCNNNCFHNPPYCPPLTCRSKWVLKSQRTRLLHELLRGLQMLEKNNEDN